MAAPSPSRRSLLLNAAANPTVSASDSQEETEQNHSGEVIITAAFMTHTCNLITLFVSRLSVEAVRSSEPPSQDLLLSPLQEEVVLTAPASWSCTP